MGGISLSSMKQINDEEFARWSGICRLDGGGFCGTRTLPFRSPLQVGDADGIYLQCRLTSDDEPDRRVWKVTTRSEQSRSEQLYQAMFDLPKDVDKTEDESSKDWNLVKIKFDDFVQVRGPRIVENGPKLNTTNGIFQIGMALSKFKISSTGEEIDNFRPGYFELQVKEIGIFKDGKQSSQPISFPGTMEKAEAEKKKPLVLKVLAPIAKLFFSETRRRRASAMRILKKRGYSKIQAGLFGFKLRANSQATMAALFHFTASAVKETLRLALFWSLRIALVYPIQLIAKAVKMLKRPKKKTEK